MRAEQIVGIIGDSLTFIGGCVLVLDSILRVKEYREAKNLSEVVAIMTGINFAEKDGTPEEGQEGAEMVSVRRTMVRAKIGAAVVTLGFLFQLISRCLEK